MSDKPNDGAADSAGAAHAPIHVLQLELPWSRPAEGGGVTSKQGGGADDSAAKPKTAGSASGGASMPKQGGGADGGTGGTPMEFPNAKPIVPDSATAQVYDRDHTGVVHIIQDRADGRDSSLQVRTDGSGFFFDSDGHIATDAHVVLPHKGALPELTIVTDTGKSYSAHIEKLDLDHDLAILKLDGTVPPAGVTPQELKAASEGKTPPDVKPLELGADARPDEKVWALGHPQGSDQLYVSPGTSTGQATNGQLDTNRYNQNFGASTCAEEAISRFAQQPSNGTYLNGAESGSEMHIEEGDSGGPVVDSKVTGLIDRGGDSPSSAFSTPVSYLKDLIKAEPSYTFSYKPDPDKPGYQILTDVRRADGSEVQDPHLTSAYTYMFQQCRQRQ